MPLDDAHGSAGLAEQPADQDRGAGRSKYRIIDADAHVNPPATFWAEYLPKHLVDIAPKFEAGKPGEDSDWIVFEGKRRPMLMLNGNGGRKSVDFKVSGKLSDMRVGGWMPAQRIEDMDRDGMDAAILFGGGPLGTTNSELYIESFAAYNRWLADFCGYAPKRLFGSAYLPMRDVDESLRMLREAAALGFHAVNIPAFPQARDGFSASGNIGSNALGGQATALTGDPFGERRYDDPEFDRLWAEISDLDMAITIHLGGRIPRFGDKKHFLPDLLMSKFAMAEPIAIMIYGGVFERFPKLRFVTVESGVGWFAFAANYMDATWDKQKHWTGTTLKNKPSFYMDQNVYGSFILDEVGIATRNLPGGRNILWSSDYPHSETTYPDSLATIERLFKDVPEAEKREILGERARRLYRID
jgi:predicted TIM-barrel fold metal-dependent hydrolase